MYCTVFMDSVASERKGSRVNNIPSRHALPTGEEKKTLKQNYYSWADPPLATAALDASHSSTFAHEWRRRTSNSTFSGANALRFFVTTFPAQENRRSDAACVPGMASTRRARLAKCGKSTLFTRHQSNGSRYTP